MSNLHIYLGCDCDENSDNPDELCPAGQSCKQCKCLPKGMNYEFKIFRWRQCRIISNLILILFFYTHSLI